MPYGRYRPAARVIFFFVLSALLFVLCTPLFPSFALPGRGKIAPSSCFAARVPYGRYRPAARAIFFFVLSALLFRPCTPLFPSFAFPQRGKIVPSSRFKQIVSYVPFPFFALSALLFVLCTPLFRPLHSLFSVLCTPFFPSFAFPGRGKIVQIVRLQRGCRTQVLPRAKTCELGDFNRPNINLLPRRVLCPLQSTFVGTGKL